MFCWWTTVGWREWRTCVVRIAFGLGYEEDILLRGITIATARIILDTNDRDGHLILFIGQCCIPPILYYKGDEFWDACGGLLFDKTLNLRIKGISLVQYFKKKSLNPFWKKGEFLVKRRNSLLTFVKGKVKAHWTCIYSWHKGSWEINL